jgi:uncharacterized protein
VSLEVFPAPDAAPFWEAAARRELALPWCLECGEPFFYPRALCPGCGSRRLEWRRASGRGRLHAFCIHHAPPLPAFRAEVPFVSALIELDEGPRMLSRLVGVEPDPAAVRCEMPLVVDFLAVEGALLPVFRPAS